MFNDVMFDCEQHFSIPTSIYRMLPLSRSKTKGSGVVLQVSDFADVCMLGFVLFFKWQYKMFCFGYTNTRYCEIHGIVPGDNNKIINFINVSSLHS